MTKQIERAVALIIDTVMSEDVVVEFYPWFKFYFLCFGYGNLMIMSLKQRK